MPKATFYGTVDENGAMKWFSPSYVRGIFSKLIGKDVEITVQKMTRKRSLDQNAYYWSTVIDIAFAIYQGEGNKHMDKEAVHEDLMRRFAPREPVVLKSEVVGHKLTRTSAMTTVQMKEYIEAIAEWLAVDYSVNLPPPDPNWRSKK